MSSQRTNPGLIAAALASVLVLITALGGTVGSLINSSVLVYLLGFEIIAVAASVFGVLIGLGRFRAGPGLGLLCVAGAVFVGSLLGYVSLPPELRTTMMGLPTKWLLLIRFGLCAVIALVAAWVVLSRRPTQSLPSLLRGVGFGVVFLGLLATLWVFRGHIGQLGQLVRTFGLLMAGIVALGLFAAAVHYSIRAFEFGRVSRDVDDQSDAIGRA